jgi:hypothetical protein
MTLAEREKACIVRHLQQCQQNRNASYSLYSTKLISQTALFSSLLDARPTADISYGTANGRQRWSASRPFIALPNNGGPGSSDNAKRVRRFRQHLIDQRDYLRSNWNGLRNYAAERRQGRKIPSAMAESTF